MDKFLEIWTKSLDNREHKKLLEIVLSIFVLISPSFSFIFMYKRDLFNKLDNIKLILLCLVVNIIIFLPFYFLVLLGNYQNKLLNNLREVLEIHKNKKESEVLQKHNLDKKDEVKEAKSEALIRVTSLMFIISILPFVYYLFNYFTHLYNDYYKTINGYYMTVITILVICPIKCIYYKFKLKCINKELKEHDIKIDIW